MKLKGIREIKLNEVEKYYLNFLEIFLIKMQKLCLIFYISSSTKIRCRGNFSFFLAITMFIFVLKDFETSKIITTLGLFTVAAIRLIPSINKIITSQQNIRFNHIAMNTIINDLKESNNQTDDKKDLLKFNDTIEINNLNFFMIKIIKS